MPATPSDLSLALEGVRRLVAALHRSARATVTRTGVTNAQLFLLRALAGGPRPIAALAAAAMTDRSAVSVALKRLTATGLVARRADPSDGRRVEYRLTAQGRARLRDAPVPPTALVLAALAAMPAARRRVFARELHALADAVGAPAAPPMLFEPSAPAVPVRASRRA